jgi:hypothetical protein
LVAPLLFLRLSLDRSSAQRAAHDLDYDWGVVLVLASDEFCRPN